MLQWECSEGRGGREQDMGYWAERARRASAPYPTTEITALMHACVFVSVWGREREGGGNMSHKSTGLIYVGEGGAGRNFTSLPPAHYPPWQWRGKVRNPGLWVYRSDWSHAGRFRANQGGWWREWAGPTIRPFPTALRHPDGRAHADWGFSSPTESERETAILNGSIIVDVFVRLRLLAIFMIRLEACFWRYQWWLHRQRERSCCWCHACICCVIHIF